MALQEQAPKGQVEQLETWLSDWKDISEPEITNQDMEVIEITCEEQNPEVEDSLLQAACSIEGMEDIIAQVKDFSKDTRVQHENNTITQDHLSTIFQKVSVAHYELVRLLDLQRPILTAVEAGEAMLNEELKVYKKIYELVTQYSQELSLMQQQLEGINHNIQLTNKIIASRAQSQHIASDAINNLDDDPVSIALEEKKELLVKRESKKQEITMLTNRILESASWIKEHSDKQTAMSRASLKQRQKMIHETKKKFSTTLEELGNAFGENPAVLESLMLGALSSPDNNKSLGS